MKIKSLFASALCLAMLASCSQDVNEPNNGGDSQGNAYVAVNLKFGDNDTSISRAETEDVDNQYFVTGESDIATYSMYIFNAEDKLETFVSDQPIKGSVGSQYTAGVNCTAGNKHIFVMLNGSIPAADLQAISTGSATPTTLQQFKDKSYSIVNDAEGSNTAPLKRNNRLLMMGHTEDVVVVSAKSAAEAEANAWPIVVTRCSGKVTVKEKTGGITISNIDATVGTDGMKWLLCNRNTHFTNCRHGWEPTYGADVFSGFNHMMKLSVVDGVIKCGNDIPVAVGQDLPKTMAGWQYASENVNNKIVDGKQNIKSGNTAYALVSVQLKPATFTVNNGAAFEDVPNDNTQTDFWVLAQHDTKSGRTAVVYHNETKKPYYFKSQADAEAFKAESGVFCGDAAPYKYTNGVSYYRTNIKTPDMTEDYQTYSIRRGRAYVVTLNEIVALGSNNPMDVNPVDPNTPLTFDNYIAASIKIAKWFGITSDAILGE